MGDEEDKYLQCLIIFHKFNYNLRLKSGMIYNVLVLNNFKINIILKILILYIYYIYIFIYIKREKHQMVAKEKNKRVGKNKNKK